MAATVANGPAGKVTEVFADKAERQGAYDLIKNDMFLAADITEAQHVATARRCAEFATVIVATDGSSLSLRDADGEKGFGRIGADASAGKGIKVHSALAQREDGVPLGLAAQHYWIRGPKPRTPSTKRKLKDKELKYWLYVRKQAREVFHEHAPSTTIWFQHDREADAWPVILDAVEPRPGEHTTIRGSWNRRVAKDDQDSPQRYLWDEMRRQGIQGRYELQVAGGRRRKARQGTFAIRACQVTLDLRNKWTKTHYTAPIWAVHVIEDGTTPEKEKPIEWMLLTTYPVHNLEDARRVVRAYSLRWKIEEFFKTWKSGSCRVEETQLRDSERVMKWAAILAGEAARQLRFTHLGRHSPDLPVQVEFDENELDALLDLSDLPPSTANNLTIGRALLLVAELGGYTGKSSGGPPGVLVVARGLKKLDVVAHAYRIRSKRQALSDPERKKR
jgi:hypothetical protein